MLEKELERKFNITVKKQKGKTYKFVSPGAAGVPDRIAIFPNGLIWFVELKKPGGQLRPLQEFRMNEFMGLGCRTAIITCEEDIRIFMEHVEKISVQEKTARFWGFK